MNIHSLNNIIGEPATATYSSTGSRFDLVSLSRKGIKKQALLNLGTALELSIKELARLLPVTERTLQRRDSSSLLSPKVSEHVILIAELTEKGGRIFCDASKFNKWLYEENTGLSGHTPLDLLDTAIGIELVSDELGKLAYGVYS